MEFDNRVPLKQNTYSNGGRFIGLSLSEPFHHQGLKRECVEAHSYYPLLIDECTGVPGLPVEEVGGYKVSQTLFIAKKVDELIIHLQDVKAKLLQSIGQENKHGKQTSLFN
ncbi:hypothetical protein [Rufibacter quisquiliarum]|uniref:Uncharacterized protein n=1 Tax=Rufibacter quisquiliarum TaxID=1549639 RepID=A0A839GF95_9BACT|nr:hypothetical protein [Rufibacter quisquiliarum]MBA9078304.1 hypothetical protein [Rufibacter quisquiliarum]